MRFIVNNIYTLYYFWAEFGSVPFFRVMGVATPDKCFIGPHIISWQSSLGHCTFIIESITQTYEPAHIWGVYSSFHKS